MFATVGVSEENEGVEVFTNGGCKSVEAGTGTEVAELNAIMYKGQIKTKA